MEFVYYATTPLVKKRATTKRPQERGYTKQQVSQLLDSWDGQQNKASQSKGKILCM
jgi:hypothetical protein